MMGTWLLLLSDVKPSNVLINALGQVKMCDFGISGYLVDSVAKTIDAGCKPYMAVSTLASVASGNVTADKSCWETSNGWPQRENGNVPKTPKVVCLLVFLQNVMSEIFTHLLHILS